jgi:hypothetical protein
MKKGLKFSKDDIFVFLMIYFGLNTMFVSNYIGALASLGILFLFVFIKFAQNYLKDNTFIFSRKILILSMVFIFNILITCFINQDFSNGNMLLIIKIILAFFFVNLLNFEQFKRSYTKVLVVISAASLLCTYFLVHTPVTNIVPTLDNSSGLQFYNFGLAFVINYPDYLRNFGIFTEPGMFVCYLIPAMVFEVSRLKYSKLSILSVLILFGTLISTFSPVGIICAFILMFAYILLNKNGSTIQKIILPIAVIVVISSLFLIPDFIFIFKSDTSSRRFFIT